MTDDPDRRSFLHLAMIGGLALGGCRDPHMAPAAQGEGAPAVFPDGFLWGAGGSAPQTEGGVTLDGRGPSIWDTFAARPGAIKGGATPAVACDGYRRWREDVALAQGLNLKSYRFSIAWPRIQPTGRGPALQAGLDHYRRLVDGVLEAGMRPLTTLYHFDLPQALEDAGGWPVRDTAERFADYCGIVAGALGDRVKHWSVMNEPRTHSHFGYLHGTFAPGRKDADAFLRATHVLNLAQGMGHRAVRAIDSAAQIGSAYDAAPMWPATDSAADRAAAARHDAFFNLWFLQPALTGRYPEGVLLAERMHALIGWQEGDEARLRSGMDWVGLNYYTPWRVKYEAGGVIPGLNATGEWGKAPGGGSGKTDLGWDIHPVGLRQMLQRMRQVTGDIPIEITENGAAFSSEPRQDGGFSDARRIAYLRQHLRELARTIAEGVPVRGYHVWSLLDNFEWADGYEPRFGLINVDFDNGQKRTPKASARWVAEIAATNRV